MTDDIVTRLRNWHTDHDSAFPRPIDLEAADEIERLREWKELAYLMRNKYWWAMRRKTLKKFDSLHQADWRHPRNVALREQIRKDFGQ